ncbi:MAG: MotA/TolQ/ExbB proton channel family protein [Myxococcota bacterium]
MAFFEQFISLMVSGGFAMPPLMACTLLLWYSLAMRALTLRRGGGRRDVRLLVRTYQRNQGGAPAGLLDYAAKIGVDASRKYRGNIPRSVLDELYSPIRADLDWGRVVIRSVVAIAPLLGLLGTVTGMIETFKSLADMALFTQGGGIAGGIAQALLTTQTGLVVSVPGIVIGRMLDRRQSNLEMELDQMEELLSAGEIKTEAA